MFNVGDLVTIKSNLVTEKVYGNYNDPDSRNVFFAQDMQKLLGTTAKIVNTTKHGGTKVFHLCGKCRGWAFTEEMLERFGG